MSVPRSTCTRGTITVPSVDSTLLSDIRTQNAVRPGMESLMRTSRHFVQSRSVEADVAMSSTLDYDSAEEDDHRPVRTVSEFSARLYGSAQSTDGECGYLCEFDSDSDDFLPETIDPLSSENDTITAGAKHAIEAAAERHCQIDQSTSTDIEQLRMASVLGRKDFGWNRLLKFSPNLTQTTLTAVNSTELHDQPCVVDQNCHTQLCNTKQYDEEVSCGSYGDSIPDEMDSDGQEFYEYFQPNQQPVEVVPESTPVEEFTSEVSIESDEDNVENGEEAVYIDSTVYVDGNGNILTTTGQNLRQHNAIMRKMNDRQYDEAFEVNTSSCDDLPGTCLSKPSRSNVRDRPTSPSKKLFAEAFDRMNVNNNSRRPNVLHNWMQTRDSVNVDVRGMIRTVPVASLSSDSSPERHEAVHHIGTTLGNGRYGPVTSVSYCKASPHPSGYTSVMSEAALTMDTRSKSRDKACGSEATAMADIGTKDRRKKKKKKKTKAANPEQESKTAQKVISSVCSTRTIAVDDHRDSTSDPDDYYSHRRRQVSSWRVPVMHSLSDDVVYVPGYDRDMNEDDHDEPEMERSRPMERFFQMQMRRDMKKSKESARIVQSDQVDDYKGTCPLEELLSFITGKRITEVQPAVPALAKWRGANNNKKKTQKKHGRTAGSRLEAESIGIASEVTSSVAGDGSIDDGQSVSDASGVDVTVTVAERLDANECDLLNHCDELNVAVNEISADKRLFYNNNDNLSVAMSGQDVRNANYVDNTSGGICDADTDNKLLCCYTSVPSMNTSPIPCNDNAYIKQQVQQHGRMSAGNASHVADSSNVGLLPKNDSGTTNSGGAGGRLPKGKKLKPGALQNSSIAAKPVTPRGDRRADLGSGKSTSFGGKESPNVVHSDETFIVVQKKKKVKVQKSGHVFDSGQKVGFERRNSASSMTSSEQDFVASTPRPRVVDKGTKQYNTDVRSDHVASIKRPTYHSQTTYVQSSVHCGDNVEKVPCQKSVPFTAPSNHFSTCVRTGSVKSAPDIVVSTNSDDFPAISKPDTERFVGTVVKKNAPVRNSVIKVTKEIVRNDSSNVNCSSLGATGGHPTGVDELALRRASSVEPSTKLDDCGKMASISLNGTASANMVEVTTKNDIDARHQDAFVNSSHANRSCPNFSGLTSTLSGQKCQDVLYVKPNVDATSDLASEAAPTAHRTPVKTAFCSGSNSDLSRKTISQAPVLCAVSVNTSDALNGTLCSCVSNVTDDECTTKVPMQTGTPFNVGDEKYCACNSVTTETVSPSLSKKSSSKPVFMDTRNKSDRLKVLAGFGISFGFDQHISAIKIESSANLASCSSSIRPSLPAFPAVCNGMPNEAVIGNRSLCQTTRDDPNLSNNNTAGSCHSFAAGMEHSSMHKPTDRFAYRGVEHAPVRLPSPRVGVVHPTFVAQTDNSVVAAVPVRLSTAVMSLQSSVCDKLSAVSVSGTQIGVVASTDVACVTGDGCARSADVGSGDVDMFDLSGAQLFLYTAYDKLKCEMQNGADFYWKEDI